MEKKELPDNAQRVFRGAIFEVWQWRQKMYDGSVQIFERLKRPDTAVTIATVADTIMVQTQKQPHRAESFLSLPGGRCEEGEDSLDAAKRELLEESGYASDDWVLWKEINPVGKIIWTVHTYVARNCRKVGDSHLDPGEQIEIKFIPFDEFLTPADNPTFYERELAGLMIRARYDRSFRKEFFSLLFP